MEEQFSRTALLIGEDGVERLQRAKVMIFGIGGVGGYVAESLARSGVGTLHLVDHDIVAESNLNRQIIATKKTIGKYKVDVMKERILEINPQAEVIAHKCFFLPETKEEFDFSEYDYVVDAVDTVTAKIQIIMQCEEAGTRVISSMGAGNKLEASMFEVADIYQTSVCPLAKVMRRELKKRNVKKCKVVYSKEVPVLRKEYQSDGTPASMEEQNTLGVAKGKGAAGRRAPGSIAFVPAAAGLILAGEVVKDLINC